MLDVPGSVGSAHGLVGVVGDPLLREIGGFEGGLPTAWIPVSYGGCLNRFGLLRLRGKAAGAQGPTDRPGLLWPRDPSLSPSHRPLPDEIWRWNHDQRRRPQLARAVELWDGCWFAETAVQAQFHVVAPPPLPNEDKAHPGPGASQSPDTTCRSVGHVAEQLDPSQVSVTTVIPTSTPLSSSVAPPVPKAVLDMISTGAAPPTVTEGATMVAPA